MKKYLVVYIVSTLGKTGPTNQLYEILKNLDREQFEPKIITLSKEPEHTRFKDFENLNIEIISLGLSRIGMIFFGGRKLRKIVSGLQPDIIHTSGYRADICSVKYLKEYKHCNTIHNYAYDDYRMTYGNLIGTLMAYKHIKILKDISCIACSYTIEDKLKKIQGLNVNTIQNGIDKDKYKAVSADEKFQIKKALGLEKYRRIFLYSGNLCKRKDPLTIINSFNKADLGEDICLVILGDGPLFKECIKLKSKNVILKGRVDNVADYLRASDVYISASLSEGLPMSALEAMGTGLLLILSGIQSHREILSGNNIGKTFKAREEDELIKLLEEYSECDISAESEEARKVFENSFTSEAMCRSYERFYKEMLNG